MGTTNFYKALITNSMPLRDLLINKSCFTAVPDDWHIVTVEVKAPTTDLGKDAHNDVNIVATGSIITVLNTIKSSGKQTQVPYFFRGNGATFLIPESIVNKVLVALETYEGHVLKNLDMIIKVGSVIIKKVYTSGATIGIAKLKLNNYLVTPIIRGNGLKIAERTIMDNFKEESKPSEDLLAIDLYGMECRWDEIFPNEQDKKVICLLVLCKDEWMQPEVFTQILDEIDYVFGNLNERRPIVTDRLKLDTSFRKMRKEMYARLGKFHRGYLVQNWLITYLGKYYFQFFRGGKEYLFRVTQLSDTIVLDGSINTVFSGTQREMNKLKVLLDTLEADGKICYGIHVTYASIMSCYIEDREENHIHFVDGTEGGYNAASFHLKQKLKHYNGSFWK